MHTYTYVYAIPFAILFYLAQHLIFLIRFSRINTEVGVGDLYILLAGALVFLLQFYLLNMLKTKQQQQWLWGVFIVTLPIYLLGSLIGGLLGVIGVVLYTVVPAGVLLGIGYAVISRIGQKKK